MNAMGRRPHAIPSWYATLRTASHEWIARCMRPPLGGADPDTLMQQGKIVVIAAMALWAAMHHP